MPALPRYAESSMKFPKVPPKGTPESAIGKKQIALGAVGVIVALSFGFAWASDASGAALAALAILPVLLAVLLLQALLIARTRILILLTLVEAAVMTAPHLSPFSKLNLAAGLCAALLLCKAGRKAAIIKNNQITVAFFEIGGHLLPAALAGIALFIGITYVQSFHFSLTEVSRETLSHFREPIEAGPKLVFGTGFSLDFTQRQLAEMLITQNPDLQKLSPTQKKAMANEGEKSLQEMMKGFGLTIGKEQTFFDGIHEVLNRQWQQASTATKLMLPVGIGLSVFYLVKLLGIVLVPLSALLGFLLYKILVWTKLATIVPEKREKEVIVFS